MAQITAAAVKALRERTGLPMMKCKQALTDAGGDEQQAIDLLRKEGAKTRTIKEGQRSTAFGHFGMYCGVQESAGAMVELKCESAPVAGHEEFVGLANDLAKVLATGSGAATAEELLAQPSPSKDGMTLQEQLDELYGRIREVFKVGRILRVEGGTGGYSHRAGKTLGALVQVEGGTDEAAKNIAMHVVATQPQVLNVEDLDKDVVAKEREILTEMSRKEGKPENIIEKMVDGRMRQFYAQHVLLEQPYVKDDKLTVGKYAKSENMTIKSFVCWELEGEEGEE